MPNTVLGKVTCTPKGDYAAGTSYEILDIVGHNGGSYMALKNDPEGAPSNDGVNWMQLAAQGGKGNTGAAAGFGDPTATVDQTTGTPSVSVEATGPNTAKVFSFAFSGIKGEQGIQGIQGETGETGEAAGFGEPTATVDNNVGTPGVTVTATGPDTAKVFSFAFVNLKGDQGEQGIQGVQGEQGEPGTSVASIQRTSGTGAPGTTDVYTMYDSAGGTIGTFTVYNGSNGSGSGDLMADGSVPMTGALNMGGNKVTNLGAPGADTDAVRKQDLDAVAAEVDGILDGTTPAHLAPATETKIGGVIIGEGLSVTEDGTLSADDQLPPSGTTGQVLTQTSTGPSWQDAPSGLPDGGTTGQILTQGANGAEWADAPDPLPSGGTQGQILTKTADGTAWQNKPSYTAAEVGARPDTWTPSASDVGAMPAVTGGTTGQVLTKTADGQEWADGGMTEAEADARYLKLSGGTMTGPVSILGEELQASLFDLYSPSGAVGSGGYIAVRIKTRSRGNAPNPVTMIPEINFTATAGVNVPWNYDDVFLSNIRNPSLDTDAANKAYVDSKAPTGQTVTLTSSGWTSTTGGYQQVVSVTGVTTDPDQIIWVDVSQSGTDLEADKALNDAWGAGPGQLKPKQQSGALQFFSIEKPTVNIPVDVVVSG